MNRPYLYVLSACLAASSLSLPPTKSFAGASAEPLGITPAKDSVSSKYPLISIDEIVQQGYQSIGAIVLKLSEAQHQSMLGGDRHAIEKFHKHLKRLAITGDISLGSQEFCRDLNHAMKVYEGLIPPHLKPQSAVQALTFACDSMQAYYGIKDRGSFLRKINLEPKNIRLGEIGGLMEGIKTDGSRFRVLAMEFKQGYESLSVISCIHELYHALQPSREEGIKIMDGLFQIPAYQSLFKLIVKDPVLRSSLQRLIRCRNGLHLLELPGIEEVAGKEGLDLSEIRKYVAMHSSRFDFLDCITEGEAGYMPSVIIAVHPSISQYGRVKEIYQLLALMDSLGAAAGVDLKQPVYGIGVGLSQYLRDHPLENGALCGSSNIHGQVSKKFVK